jgi:poly(3-hydroxybutyrate) depolymerase
VPDPKLFAAAAAVSDLLSNGTTASPERPRATVDAHAETAAAVADSGAPWRVAVDAAMCAEIEALAGGVGIYSSGRTRASNVRRLGWEWRCGRCSLLCVCTHSAMSVRRDALGDGM